MSLYQSSYTFVALETRNELLIMDTAIFESFVWFNQICLMRHQKIMGSSNQVFHQSAVVQPSIGIYSTVHRILRSLGCLSVQEASETV